MLESDGPILILTPGERNDDVTADILRKVGAISVLCPDPDALVMGLDGAVCAVVTEEAIAASDHRALAAWIQKQPPWSDFPFILLTERGAEPRAAIAEMLCNVTAVERPFHPSTLVSAVRAAARARRRQREAEANLREVQRTADRQALLIRELHHRVKNTLASVQGILGATVRHTASVPEFYRSFTGRIVSLARTHDLLTNDYWQTAPLETLLRNELGPYVEPHENRLLLSGPKVELAADLAIPTGMAIHELTLNAVQHGALSIPQGRLSVTWDVVHEDGRQRLHLEWIERDGPQVERPALTGFGSIMLQRVLTDQCNATIQFEFEATGLRFAMDAPLIEQRLVPAY